MTNTTLTISHNSLPSVKDAWEMFKLPSMTNSYYDENPEVILDDVEDIMDDIIDFIYDEIIGEFRPEGPIDVNVIDIPTGLTDGKDPVSLSAWFMFVVAVPSLDLEANTNKNIETQTVSTTVFNITIPVKTLKEVEVEYCDEDDDKYPDPLREDITRLWETASESLYQNGKEVRELLNNGSTVELYVEFDDGQKKVFEAFDLGFLKQ